jgi:hypothetical protein
MIKGAKKMKMMIYAGLIYLLAVVLLTAGCSQSTTEMESTSDFGSNEEIVIETTVETAVTFDSLSEVVEFTDFIVTGKVIAEELFDASMNTTIYTVSIDQIIKGMIEEETIDVYEQKGTYPVGEHTIFFLGGWSSPLYPNPVFTSISKDMIVTSNGGKKSQSVIQAYHDIDLLTSEVLKIARSYSGPQAEVTKTIKEAKDFNELVNLSDYILYPSQGINGGKSTSKGCYL